MEWFKSQKKKLVTGIGGEKINDENDEEPSLPPLEIKINIRSSSGPLTARSNLKEELDALDNEFDEPNIRDTLFREREKFQTIISEYNRKVHVLTSALEEKVEHTTSMALQVRNDEITIQEYRQIITNLEMDREKLLRQNTLNDSLTNELNRRIETLTHSLEMLAIENVDLQSLIPMDELENIREVFEESSPNEKDRVDLGLVQLLSAEIEELEFKIKHMDSQILMQTKRAQIHQQQILAYETKIQKLQEKSQSSLLQESEKRKEAEKEVKLLQSRIKELEIVLSQEIQISTDSDNDNTHKGSIPVT